jgi:diguanylate cyclase (GGDEF)-like protein
MALSQTQSLLQQYDRQLRRLEKITRISDRYQRNLLELNDRLRQAALKDPLTGLANRRLLMERLREEQERCQRGQAPFSLAMLDVDYFKRINDRHGHDVGDRVLCLLAQTIDEQLRGYDLCARWGGEEFMLLLPGTDIAQARRLSERIMARVRELRLPDLGQHARLTVSVGLAIHRSGEAVDQTIGRADSELLQAKRQGRDRLMVATL